VGTRSCAGARQELERICDQLRGLELRLSYSVKAPADLGLVLSMRAESFYQALSESMGLAGRAAAARLQERLEAAISAELTAIESVERRTHENRRVRYAVVVHRG
jgi:predicted component of type VI protein secretion system